MDSLPRPPGYVQPDADGYEALRRLSYRDSDGGAYFEMGNYHYFSETPNLKQALLYYGLAADRTHPHPQAAFNVGFMYEMGQGHKVETSRAEFFYRSAAKHSLTKEKEKTPLTQQAEARLERLYERRAETLLNSKKRDEETLTEMRVLYGRFTDQASTTLTLNFNFAGMREANRMNKLANRLLAYMRSSFDVNAARETASNIEHKIA